MNKILVTGVNGFVGHHVAATLHEMGYIIVGASNQPEVADELSELVENYYSCDLTDPEQVAKIDLSDIDAIINLAGFAKVGESRGQGELYNRINVGVHTTLYQECINQGVSPRIIAVSTGAVYDPSQPLPITEESALIPDDKTNEYTISKKKMEQALEEFREQGLHIITARPFNHSGPGQLPGFLLPDLGEQIEGAKKQNSPLLVGNLTTKRDYTDVRDVARAYVELATCPKENLNHSLYNICSGVSTEGMQVLDLLKSAFDGNDISVEVDQSRIRPNDVMDIYGSRDRLSSDTGWEPTISVKQMVNDYAAWKKSI
jgi:GDP-4-dehydro-6-deoxy-D-mannose reductase